MIVTQYGQIVIDQTDIKIVGFKFSGEGASLEECFRELLKWARNRLDDESEEMEISDGGGNTMNGFPGLDAFQKND